MTLRRQQALINAALIEERAKVPMSSENYRKLDRAVKLGEQLSDHLYDMEKEKVG